MLYHYGEPEKDTTLLQGLVFSSAEFPREIIWTHSASWLHLQYGDVHYSGS